MDDPTLAVGVLHVAAPLADSHLTDDARPQLARVHRAAMAAQARDID